MHVLHVAAPDELGASQVAHPSFPLFVPSPVVSLHAIQGGLFAAAAGFLKYPDAQVAQTFASLEGSLQIAFPGAPVAK